MSRSTEPKYWGIVEPDDAFLVAFWFRKNKDMNVKAYIFDGFDVLSTPVSSFLYKTENRDKSLIKATTLLEALAVGAVNLYSLRDKSITYTEVVRALSSQKWETIYGSCSDQGPKKWGVDVEK